MVMQLKGISVDKESWENIRGMHNQQENRSSEPKVHVK